MTELVEASIGEQQACSTHSKTLIMIDLLNLQHNDGNTYYIFIHD